MGYRLDQPGKIGFQLIETGQLFERLLIHVQRAVDFDLQTLPVRVRTPVPPHDLDPLVTLVDPDIVSEAAQKAGDEIGEILLAGRAVAVAENEIPVFAPPPEAPVSVRRHRVAVDMPYRAERVVQLVNAVIEHAVIRLVIALDPGENILGFELAIIDRDAGPGVATNQPDPRHRPRRQRWRRGARQDSRVEI